MLQTFYNNFGFLGALLISTGLFIFFIFWISGIAGITELPESPSKKWKIIFSALVPPYPIIWLIIDMYKQHRYMNTDTN